jgi:LPS export ABC transporter protein LptC
MLRIIIETAILFICSCAKDKNASTIIASNSSGDSVSQILEYSAITAYRENNKLWELKAIKMTQATADKKLSAAPVKITIFDDSSRVSAVLTADNGVANEKVDSLFVWGNVKIDAVSGEKLSSPSLQWDKKEKLLLSNDLVEISTADGEIIRGRGFRAAENFEWWEFAGEVSGTFSSVEAELNKE